MKTLALNQQCFFFFHNYSDSCTCIAMNWLSDNAFTLWHRPFDTWPRTFVVGRVSRDRSKKYEQNETIRRWVIYMVIYILANFRRWYVTLWPWPFTPWSCTFVVDRTCDVNNSNLPPLLHRFRDTADNWFSFYCLVNTLVQDQSLNPGLQNWPDRFQIPRLWETKSRDFWIRK